MDVLGVCDRSLDLLDLDLFPSTQIQMGILDALENGNDDCFSDILPDLLDHGFDHLSTLPLDDDDFGLGSEILGRDSSAKLSPENTAFLDVTKVWPSQLDLLSGPLLQDDDLIIPKEQAKPKSVENVVPYTSNVKAQRSIHSVESDSDLDIDSSDDVDIETIDDSERGRSCAEILYAKLATLANDDQAARVRAFHSFRKSITDENIVNKEATGYDKPKPKKVVSEKPQVASSVSKPKFKLKDSNPSMLIEKIKQSSANRRGSILISQQDVPQKCKNNKTASSPKSKVVKSDSVTLKATCTQSTVDHDYCSDVVVVKRTTDTESLEIDTANTIDCSSELTWLESDNCMVVEEIIEDCPVTTMQDVACENVPLVEIDPWTENSEIHVQTPEMSVITGTSVTATSLGSDALSEQNYSSHKSGSEKEYENCWEKVSETKSRLNTQKRQQLSKWRSRRYRSSCSPSNSSSSHSAYRSRSRSPSRSRRRHRNSHYSRSSSRSSSRSRSRSWSRSPSRSWSRKRDYPRFKRKERRSPSPVYQNRMRQKHFQDDKLNQIDERRVIFVGKIPDGSTKTWLRQRFGRFGHIQEVSIHFRDNGDNYGFVTFMYKCDAFEALEHGNDNKNEPKLDLCFGGRRQFCGRKYSDLDAQYSPFSTMKPNSRNSGGMDFDSLLNAAKAQIRKPRH